MKIKIMPLLRVKIKLIELFSLKGNGKFHNVLVMSAKK